MAEAKTQYELNPHIIGIDPGATGALAWLPVGNVVVVADMPSLERVQSLQHLGSALAQRHVAGL